MMTIRSCGDHEPLGKSREFLISKQRNLTSDAAIRTDVQGFSQKETSERDLSNFIGHSTGQAKLLRT